MNLPEQQSRRRINVHLPTHLIERIDQLKKELGLRARGDIIERLLEDLLEDPIAENDLDDSMNTHIDQNENDQFKGKEHRNECEIFSEFDEQNALVLVGTGKLNHPTVSSAFENIQESKGRILFDQSAKLNSGIDLPGFVRKRTDQMKDSLRKIPNNEQSRDIPMVQDVSDADLKQALEAARDHWINLYGQPAGETVLEAVMIWLGRDIWPSVDGVDGRAFTWTAANRSMQELSPNWLAKPATFERVIVVAGVLEDPFATQTLSSRIPTLIRRFVNRFKRSRQVTSFQTLESTMTVQGALHLLGLSTKAGAAHTLKTIRDAYKAKAINAHPDAGGSTELMRKLNEGYQLLRDLYRQKI